MCGCQCWGFESAPGFERAWGPGYRHGPPPWARFWPWGWSAYGLTKAERKEGLEALKKHLEEQLAKLNEELGRL